MCCIRKTQTGSLTRLKFSRVKCGWASLFERPVDQATGPQFPFGAPSFLYNLEAGATPEPSGLASLVPPLRLKIPGHLVLSTVHANISFALRNLDWVWRWQSGTLWKGFTSIGPFPAASSPAYTWLVNGKRQWRRVPGKGGGLPNFPRATEVQLKGSTRMRDWRKVLNLVGFYMSNMPAQR